MKPEPTPRAVSAALRRRGIPNGYRYTAFGYTLHDGTRVTTPGCMVTSRARQRYGGTEVLDHPHVYPVMPDGNEPPPTFTAQVVAALMGEGWTVYKSGTALVVASS